MKKSNYFEYRFHIRVINQDRLYNQLIKYSKPSFPPVSHSSHPQKNKGLSSSALLANGARSSHLVGIAFLIFFIFLPVWMGKYLDQKRGSPQGASCRSAKSSSCWKAGEVMLLREKMRSLASMLILMWTVGLLGVTLRFHPMQMFPSNQVRSRYWVYRSLICPCSLWISPSIELAYYSKTYTAPPFSFLFFISKYYITSASQTLPSTTFQKRDNPTPCRFKKSITVSLL